MGFLLSVDGGGTKTEFCLSDSAGNQKGTFFSGSSNYKSVGAETVYENLKNGFLQIEDAMGIGMTEIDFSVWGISGCDSDSDYKVLEDLISRLGFSKEQFFLCNDALLAFYAQAQEPGMVLISGTGSIVMGINEAGTIKRAGGWGYNLSDVGSGYWIGNEALKRTLLYCDGCYRYSSLYDEVREYFRADSFEALPYKLTEIRDYFETAKAAYLVTEESRKGDLVSQSILKEGAGVLADLAKSVYGQLEFDGQTCLTIVLSGGVLKSEEYQRHIKEALEERISLDRISFAVQKNEPVYGGIKLAMQLSDRG